MKRYCSNVLPRPVLEAIRVRFPLTSARVNVRDRFSRSPRSILFELLYLLRRTNRKSTVRICNKLTVERTEISVIQRDTFLLLPFNRVYL